MVRAGGYYRAELKLVSGGKDSVSDVCCQTEPALIVINKGSAAIGRVMLNYGYA